MTLNAFGQEGVDNSVVLLWRLPGPSLDNGLIFTTFIRADLHVLRTFVFDVRQNQMLYFSKGKPQQTALCVCNVMLLADNRSKQLIIIKYSKEEKMHSPIIFYVNLTIFAFDISKLHSRKMHNVHDMVL